MCDKDERQLAAFPKKKDATRVIEALYKISYFSKDYDKGKEKAELGLDRPYWIGLFDLGHEGQWEWLDRRTYLTYKDLWVPGQPDHVGKGGLPTSAQHQHCVTLWNPFYYKTTDKEPMTHSFDDKECHFKYYFICQRYAGPKLIFVPPVAQVESFEYYSEEAMQEFLVPEPPEGHVDRPPGSGKVDCDKLKCDPKYYKGLGWIPNVDQNGKNQCAGGVLKCRKKTRFDTECIDKPVSYQKENAAFCEYLQLRYHNGDKHYDF